MITKNTSIRLTEEDQATLTRIAEAMGCRLGTGKPSWRKLIHDLAKDTFILFDKRKPRKKKEWKKKGKTATAKIPGAPDWWAPWYGNAMGLELALKRSGLDRDGIKALGLTIQGNDRLRHPDVVVGRPEWPSEFLPNRCHWWWMPEDDSTMNVVDATGISDMTLEQFIAGGLILSDDEAFLKPPDSWTAWMFGKKDDQQH